MRHAYHPARTGLQFLSIALALLLLGFLGVSLADTATPDNTSRADLVIDLGDGRQLTRRITFTAPSISGLDALQLTDLDLEVATFGFGAAVCAIEGVGCPASDCFCNASQYWGYHFWQPAGWQGYSTGPSNSSIGDGAVEGWIWGPFGSTPPDITPEILAAEAALQWMRPQQDDDGSYGGNVGATLDVMLAVAAANHDPLAWKSNSGFSLVDSLYQAGATFAGRSAASAGKLALGLAAADQDPRGFAGLDLVISLTHAYDPATGAFGANNQDQAFAMLGLVAAGEALPPAAAQHLADSANPNGGWGWFTGIESDVDSTAMALQALVAAGQPLTHTAITGGLSFLQAVQNSNTDGGFAHAPGLPWATHSNTNSTAFAIQGLLAAGQDPDGPGWAISNTLPISFLLGQQLPDGAFVYQAPPADLFATQQAVPALVGKSYPYHSRAVALRKALGWIATQQQADGSFAGFGTGATIDALMAIVAAGANPASFVSDAGYTALDFLAAQADSYSAAGASQAGKLASAVVASGGNPAAFGGVDLVGRVQDTYAGGAYGSGATWDQAWAMLGLVASRQPVPDAAILHLADIQATGGGWGFSANAPSADVDSTALALQALAASGADRNLEAVSRGLDYLQGVQNPDGGFPGYGGATDAASTGLALQALAAYQENPRGLRWTTTVTDGTQSRLTLHTPLEAIQALQSPQGGFLGFGGTNDPFSTYQALPGIAGKPLPLAALRPIYLPLLLQQ